MALFVCYSHLTFALKGTVFNMKTTVLRKRRFSGVNAR